jgi:hypothetical protein
VKAYWFRIILERAYIWKFGLFNTKVLSKRDHTLKQTFSWYLQEDHIERREKIMAILKQTGKVKNLKILLYKYW